MSSASKRRELDQLIQQSQQQPEDLGRFLQRVYAALYKNVPWLAVIAICLYLPGIVLWAVFALRCKADTFIFLTTIAPVAPETVDGVSNLVNTTLIALITTATFIFMLALVLAIARSMQKAGAAPHSSFPCVRNSPSSFYLYRVFNLGYNFIVFFVNMFIIFLMMGAFVWLVVAYGANLSIKGGVLDAAQNGFRPQLQLDLARQNYTTVVSYYEQQVKRTPPCVRNTTWFKGINSSIASILKPAAADTGSNTVLCPQSCLNLGSWTTLFKLKSNCMCEQEKLYLLQSYSLAVATDAGVALGGLILIYFGSACMHVYLITEHTRAGYDYRRAKRQASRRLQNASSANSNDTNPRGGGGSAGGTDRGGPGSGGAGGAGGGAAGGLHDSNGKPYGPGAATAAAGHHVIAMNGTAAAAAGDGHDSGPGLHAGAGLGSLAVGGAAHGVGGGLNSHAHSNSGSSALESVTGAARGGGHVESRGDSFSIIEEPGSELEAAARSGGSRTAMPRLDGALLPETAAAAAGALAAAAAASGSDISPFAAGGDALLQQQQQQQQRVQLHHLQQRHHHRVSSGGGSSSSPASAASRQLQRFPSPHNVPGRSAAVTGVAGGLLHHHAQPDSAVHGPAAAAAGGSARAGGSGSRVLDWQQQQQLMLGDHSVARAASPLAVTSASGAGWSSSQHGRSESRSSTSSIRDLLSGAVPLDSYGHVPRQQAAGLLTPTSSGNAAAAMAAAAVAAVPMEPLPEVPSPVADAGSSAALTGLPLPAAATGAVVAAGAAGSSSDFVRHRRGDSQQSNSSSSSYDTVVCHSPRSSDQESSSGGVAQSVMQASAAASSSKALLQQQHKPAAGGGQQQEESAAAPAADGEEALSGSRTGSWSKKQAHRRLPALDFTKAAPALWLAQEGEQQQQPDAAAGALEQQQQQQPSAAAAGAAAAGVAAAAAAAASRAVVRAPVRRHIALDGSVSVAGLPQQQQQQQGKQLPSFEAVESMLQPSPEPSSVEEQQQQEEEQDFQQQQQQRRQRPPYSMLLPPPEQHELQLKQQQQQLQLLLQQSQEEQQQQQQQAWQLHHQRQWSNPGGSSPGLLLRQQQPQVLHHHHSYSTPDGSGAMTTGTTALGGGFITPRQQQQQQGTVAQQQGRPASVRGSFGLGITRASSAGSVGAVSLQQQQQQQGVFLGLPGSSYGVGGMRLPGSSSAASGNADEDSSPGDGAGSMSSSSRGWAPVSSSVSTAAAAVGLAAGAAAGGAGGYRAPSSLGGGDSGASSIYSTPQPTPHGSPAAPLRSGRVTPSYGQQLGSSSVMGAGAGGVGGSSSSSSWSQVPLGPVSHLTASSSYSGSANHPGYAGGLNSLHVMPGSGVAGGGGTPVPVLSPLGGEGVAGGAAGSGGFVMPPPLQAAGGPAATAIPPIPEIAPAAAEGWEASEEGGALSSSSGLNNSNTQQQDVVMESPLERRRSGYRSSMRKGLMAYDQYKHRQRYQEALSQPLDPGSSELARRYRSRMPAI